jgi:hypothetical protein
MQRHCIFVTTTTAMRVLPRYQIASWWSNLHQSPSSNNRMPDLPGADLELNGARG